MFEKRKRRIEAFILAAVTVLASFSVNWSALAPKAAGEVFAVSTGQSFVQIVKGTSDYTEISSLNVSANLEEQQSVSITTEVYIGTSIDANALSAANKVDAGTSLTISNTADAPTATEDNPDVEYTESTIKSGNILGKTISLSSQEYAAIKVTVNSISGVNPDNDNSSVDFVESNKSTISDKLFTPVDGSTALSEEGGFSGISGESVTTGTTPSTDDTNYEVKIADSDKTVNLVIYGSDKTSKDVSVSINPALDRTITLSEENNAGKLSINGTTLTAESSGSTTVKASADGAKSDTLIAYVYTISNNKATALTYNGKSQEAGISVSLGTAPLTKDIDYTVTYVGDSYSSTVGPTAAGTYDAVITGLGQYAGLSYTVSSALTINKANLAQSDFTNATITVDTDSNTVTAVANAADSNGNALVLGQDFTATSVTPLSTYEAGKAYYNIVFSGAGNYSGDVTISKYEVATTDTSLIDISKNFTLRLTKTNAEADTTEYSEDVYKAGVYQPSFKFYSTRTASESLSSLPSNAYTYIWTDPNGNSQNVNILNAGKYTLTVTGNQAAGYTGTLTATFTVTPIKLFDYTVNENTDENNSTRNILYDIAKDTFVYTGSAITPEITNVRYYATAFTTKGTAAVTPTATLIENTDYTISTETNGGSIGKHYAEIVGKGNYTGVVKVPYTVVGNLSNTSITIGGNATAATSKNNFLSGYTVGYADKEYKPAVVVTMNGFTLAEDVDYTLSYSNNENASITTGDTKSYATVTLTGKGVYAGQTQEAYFTITPLTLSSDALTITKAGSTKTYTGSEITLTSGKDNDYYVTYGSSIFNKEVLEEGKDYILDYVTKDHTNAGTVKVTATGIGNYSGTTDAKTFTIEALDASKTTITLSETEYQFDGTEKTPTVTVKDKTTGNEIPSANYEVSYKNNTQVGTATVTITGKSNLSGTNSATFKIVAKSLNGLTYTIGGSYTLTGRADQSDHQLIDYSETYTGRKIKPSVVIKDGNYTLVNGTDYFVTYSNNLNVGSSSSGNVSPTILITGKNNYENSTQLFRFNITPKSIDSTDISKKWTYSETDSKVTFTLKDKKAKATLAETTDYTITTYDTTSATATTITPTKAGQYSASIKGNRNYTGTTTISYEIGNNLANAEITPYANNRGDLQGKGVFEYLGGNMPYVVVTYKGTTLTGPTYTAGNYSSTETNPDYYVTFDPEDPAAGNSLSITITANPNNATNKYFGTKTISGYPVYQRNLSNLNTTGTTEITYTDKNAQANTTGTGTKENPIIYSVNDTGTITPDIIGEYSPSLLGTSADGTVIFQDKTVSNGGTKKAEVTGFTVRTDNSSDTSKIDTSSVHSGTMTITGTGNYTGDVTLYYKVAKASVGDVTVEDYDDIKYDGEAHKNIHPTVKLGDRVLTEGTDYTVAYPDSTNYTDVGTYNYNIVATDDSPVFTGTIKGTFEIVAADLSEIDATVSNIADQTYTGKPIELKGTNDATITLPSANYFNVVRKDKTTKNILTPSTTNSDKASDGDYYYTYSRVESTDNTDHTDPGKVVLTIHGRGNYTGEVTGYFYISADITNSDLFTVNGNLKTGTSSTNRQTLYLLEDGSLTTDDNKAFSLDDINITYNKTSSADSTTSTKTELSSDFYTVSNPDLGTVGNKTITITGNKPYAKGTLTYYVSVVGDASGMVVRLSSGNGVTVSGPNSDGSYNLDYNGQKLYPTITVSFRGKVVSPSDYKVVCNNVTNVGRGSIVVTGTGNALKAEPPKTIPVNVLYNLNKATVDFGGPYTYTGSEIRPEPTVSINGTTLSKGIDYSSSVMYQSNISVGTAYGTISSDDTTSGRSYGSTTASFEIAAEPLIDSDVTVSTTPNTEYTGVYNATEQKPTVTVKHNNATLTIGTDYTVAYANNVDAGTATVTVTGTGGYTGTIQKEFTIAQKGINSLTDITVGDAFFISDNVEVRPTVVVKDGNTTLTEGTDYTISDWSNNTDVGTASFVLYGAGNYDSSKTVNFTIKATSLSNAAVKLTDTEAEYTGNKISPTVTVQVKNGDTYSTVDSKYYDFTVTNSSDIIDAGEYECKITAKSGQKKFTGSKSFSFTVTGKELNFIDDTWNSTSTDTDDSVEDKFALYYQDESGNWQALNKDTYPSFTYDYAVNKEIPGICLLDTSSDIPGKTDQNTVGVNGVVLKKGVDYELSYTNNGAAGSAKDTDIAPTLTITGLGNYANSIVRTFNIGTDLSGSLTKVTLSKKSFYYNGENQYPTVLKVSYNGKTLTADTDYTVTYPTSNIDAGTYQVAVTGKGKYYGTYNAEYTIKPKTLSSGKIGIIYTDSTLQKDSAGKYFAYYNDGEKFEPEIDVYDKSITVQGSDNGLKLDGTDYDVAYGDDTHDNITGGTTGKVIVTLKGNYSGKATATFSIKKIDISSFELSFTGDIDGDETDGYTATYTGSPVTSDFYIMGSEADDATGQVYQIDSTDDDASTKISYVYANNTDVGEATLTVTGTGNYTGSIQKSIGITGDLEDSDLTTVKVSDASYTGSEVDPKTTVTYAGKTLTEGTDYTTKYESSDNWETSGTVTITGKGYYTGTVTADYTITFDGVYTMTGLAESYPYTGEAIKPEVTITNSNTGTTIDSSNYTVTYSSAVDGSACIEPGIVTVTAIVSGGPKTVTLTGTYEIVAGSIYDYDVSGIESSYDYTGKVIKPVTASDITVSKNGIVVPEKYYTVEYPDTTGYTLPGSYTVRILGKDAYSGYKDLHYTIKVPTVANLKQSKSGTTTASITWDAVGVATGYRITYVVESKRYTYTTTGTSYDLTGLPKSSVTTVSVNAYLKSGSNTYYSATSNVSVSTTLGKPTITSTSNASSGNTINWNKVATSGGYMIYRCASKNGNYYQLASVSSNVSTFTDTRAKSGKTYYYKVASFRVDSDGNKYDFSEKSDPVAVKTK